MRNYLRFYYKLHLSFIINSLILHILSVKLLVLLLQMINTISFWIYKLHGDSRFIDRFCLLILKHVIFHFEAFKSKLDSFLSSLLKYDHIDEALIWLFLTANHLLDRLFFRFVKYSTLSIIAWAFFVLIRRLMYKYLAEFLSKK